MSRSETTLSAREQELLKLVEQNRDRRCQEILEEARQQASDSVRQAYRSARARLHQAIENERHRAQRQIAAAQAELQSRHRQQHYHLAWRLLHAAWQQLEPALERRWQEQRWRGQWLDYLVTQALERLPAGRWQITHPPDWSKAEREQLARRLRERLGEAPSFEADSGIQAGLRIATDGVCLDGTVEGLLRDHAAIEAQLLHELKPLLAGEAEASPEATDTKSR